MKALILGANSFLAVELAQKLKGYELDGVIHERRHLLQEDKFRKIYTDLGECICDRRSYEIIFLLGAYIPDNAGTDDPRLEENAEVTERLCRAFPEAKMVLASSVAVYGTPDGVLTESTSSNMPSAYGKSKLKCEEIVKKQKHFAIVRFSALWGKNMRRKAFLPLMCEQARSGRITLYGKGERLQNHLHVSDAAQFLILSSGAKVNQLLLGVFPRSVSNLQVAEKIAAHFGVGIDFVAGNEGPSFVYDAEATYSSLNFVPSVDVLKSKVEEYC